MSTLQIVGLCLAGLPVLAIFVGMFIVEWRAALIAWFVGLLAGFGALLACGVIG